MFFLFFSVGCGHCKAMKPAYMEAADEMKALKVWTISGLVYE
jgi:thiol-disulfide isomerase/thioredoxin